MKEPSDTPDDSLPKNMPQEVREFLDSCDGIERRGHLKIIARMASTRGRPPGSLDEDVPGVPSHFIDVYGRWWEGKEL